LLAVGQSVTIIDNDGTDAVDGAFYDAPHGGTVSGLPSSYRVFYNGGDGNDTLVGTRFADVLVGGLGDDRITGGAGRDILIGGGGADRLAGGADDDVLIGGATLYSPDADVRRRALQDLLAAWASGAADYLTRAAQLAAGVGSPAARLASDTITRDGVRDTLTSDAGRDLLFAVFDPAAQPDVVKGRKKDETVVAV
jgi:Ca2+-binding RTX toxin-like protein